jgi:hypothetical protein
VGQGVLARFTATGVLLQPGGQSPTGVGGRWEDVIDPLQTFDARRVEAMSS